MNEITKPSIMKNYDYDLAYYISKKENISIMEGFKLFVKSETYKMLKNNNLRMWYFSSLAIYDMWLNEINTGDPRNSLYLRSDEV